MANVTTPDKPGFPEVYELAVTDPVAGGPDGVDNLPHKQLAERTEYLKAEADKARADIDAQDKRLGLVEGSSAVAVSRAQERAWAESDEGFSFEMFGDSIHTWRNVADVAVTRSVDGDDSVDVESTRGLSPGSSYVIFDEGGVETIVVGEILTSTRFKATANLKKTRTSGTLGLTNWDIKSGYAIAPAGGVFYSKPLDILRYWSDGIIVVRRDNDNGKVSISTREIGSAEWLPAEYVSSKLAADNTADVRYRIPVGGIVELRVKVEGSAIRIEHMMLLTSPQAGRAPAIEKGVNLIPADGAINQMDPLTVKASVARSLFGKDMASCTFLFYSDAEGKTLVHTGVVDTPTGEPEYTAPGGTYGENGIGSWQYYYTDIDGAVAEKSDLTGFSMSDVFQFTQTPTMIAPVADAEISATGATIVLDDMQVEPGGTGEHVASQYRLTSDAAGLVTVYDSGEVADLLSHVVSAALDRGIKLYAWARQKDAVRGWSAWVGGVPFMTEVIGHGVRVDGGIALGPILYADFSVGWLVAAPGSLRIAKAWGLNDVDTVLDNFEGKTIDTRTGEENTSILNSSTYANHVDSAGNVGSPAAKYCESVDFEDCRDFFFPNMPELIAIRKYKDLIDAADETGVNSVASQLTTYGGFLSSTELDIDDVNIIREHYLYPTYLASKATAEHLVLPCRKIPIPTTVERVVGGIKIGPLPFADGEFGDLIIPLASQRPFAKWGLKDSSISAITNVGFSLSSDPNTGEYNTNVLTGSSCNSITDAYGNTGCPAANACAAVDSEGVTGFSLASSDELRFILSVKDQIDAIDIAVSGSDANTFSNRSANYCWSSTSLNSTNAIAVRISDGDVTGKDKDGSWYVVPCKRVITGV